MNLNPHQVYGSGESNNSGAISHSFIELYNTTDKTISLDGFSLHIQNGISSHEPNGTEWEKYDFSAAHKIEPNSSFLIRLAETSPSARYVIPSADVDWISELVLSNRAYSVALTNNQNTLSKIITTQEIYGVIDLVGALESSPDESLNYAGNPFMSISEQKSIRRTNFQNTYNNNADFAIWDYSSAGVSEDYIEIIRPRWSGDGAWQSKIVESNVFAINLNANGISDFWIEGSSVSNAASYTDGRKNVDMINWSFIGGKHYIVVPQSADLSSLKVFFTANGTVTVNGIELTSAAQRK